MDGNLTIVDQAVALVLFAHGSGSSRHSPRNQFVARRLNDAGLATLLFDLLTSEEEAVDLYTREHRFNIGLLAERLLYATRWAHEQKQTRDLRVSCFGSSTGAAAALMAAAELPDEIAAVVSRGRVREAVHCECGAPLFWGARFCAQCGRAVDAS